MACVINIPMTRALKERLANRYPPLKWPAPSRGSRMSIVLGHPEFSEPGWMVPKLPEVSRYQMEDECYYLVKGLTEMRSKAADEVAYCETKGWEDLAVENRFLFVQYDIAMERTYELAPEFHAAKYDHCPELIQRFYRECMHPEKFDVARLTEAINARMTLWVNGLGKELTVAFHAMESEGVRAEQIATDWLRRSQEERVRLRDLIFWDREKHPVKSLDEGCSCKAPFIRNVPSWTQAGVRLIRCTKCLNVFVLVLPHRDIYVQAEPQFVERNGE